MSLFLPKKVFVGLATVLFLTACGTNPQSSRDMYIGGSDRSAQKQNRTYSEDKTGISNAISPSVRRELSQARMAALKEYGLEETQDPKNLIGMKSFDLRRVLGEPAFVRREAGVEIWQYQSSECILDLFLYDRDAGLIVDHTEIRGPQLNSPYRPDCFSNMLQDVS